MKRFKKVISLALLVTMGVGILSSCNGKTAEAPKPEEPKKETIEEVKKEENKETTEPVVETSESVYYLNFKPEIADTYAKIVDDYAKETGKVLKVVTAASGQYEQTLRSEVAKSEMPTLFQINGPVGYQNWVDYCLDIKDSKIYDLLTDKSLAVTSNGGVYGVPYVVEGYGIIYNNAIMDKYFSSDFNKSGLKSMSEVNDFALLKKVVEDMSANLDVLGIKGVFASTSLKEGDDWRWQTHLSNVPFYYEFKDVSKDNPLVAGLEADKIEFKYSDNFKNLFDLYIDNSITAKTLLGAKSVDESMAEFALGNVAMVQNGNWAWSQISGVTGNTVKSEDIKFLPLYTGMSEDKNQGLCVGTENYFAVNSQVSPEKQKATLEFLEWLFTSETGKKYVTNDLGFIAPFSSFEEKDKPTDPLAKEILAWMESGKNSVPWTFAAYPSENFKKSFGGALLEYAQGNMKWDEVKTIVVDEWEAEKANN